MFFGPNFKTLCDRFRTELNWQGWMEPVGWRVPCGKFPISHRFIFPRCVYFFFFLQFLCSTSTTARSSTSLSLKSCPGLPRWVRWDWVSSSRCSSSSTRASSSHSRTYPSTSKTSKKKKKKKTQKLCCSSCTEMPLPPHQAAQRDGFSLGPDADRLHKHPHVLSGAALDARRLPALALARPSAGQSGTARGERAPLHDVSDVTDKVSLARNHTSPPVNQSIKCHRAGLLPADLNSWVLVKWLMFPILYSPVVLLSWARQKGWEPKIEDFKLIPWSTGTIICDKGWISFTRCKTNWLETMSN